MGVKDWKGMYGRKLWGRPRLKSQGEREGEYKIATQWVIGAKKVKVKQSKAVPLHAMEAHGGEEV
jgi:hypothetical protein